MSVTVKFFVKPQKAGRGCFMALFSQANALKEFRGVTQRTVQSHNKTSTKVQGVIPQLSQQKTKTESVLL